MPSRTVYKTGRELVGAFLKDPLPKDLFQLSRHGKIDPPWAPPLAGSGPEDYAACWTLGYDGGPIRGAFRWLGLQDPTDVINLLPKSFRKRGRAPKAVLIDDFRELPEAERMILDTLRHGAAMHDIRDVVMGFKQTWEELDKIRPLTWAIEDMIEILHNRTHRGRSIEAVPASMVFLWNASDEPYHYRQLERAERLLVHALKEVMPGTHR